MADNFPVPASRPKPPSRVGEDDDGGRPGGANPSARCSPVIVSQGSGRGENPFRPLGRLRVAIPAVLPVPTHGFPGRPQCPSCWGEHGRGGCHRREQGTAALPPSRPCPRRPSTLPTGIPKTPACAARPPSLRARRHLNSKAARERPFSREGVPASRRAALWPLRAPSIL